MKVEAFVVNTLLRCGVTDAFGIPGGVVLKLLGEMESRRPEFTPHLCCNEQSAGFAACGYAQQKGTLGVAYATRGPGIANMVTCMAEAYQESLPVLFLTAHGRRTHSEARFDQNQELDICSAVSGFTKYAQNVETPEEVAQKLTEACQAALSGRKGPVLLDFYAPVWGQEIPDAPWPEAEADNPTADVGRLAELLAGAKRPVLLIGDGLRFSFDKMKLFALVRQLGIPVLSSRGAQDLLCGCNHYYGYIGSHGTRYSNFILSKADLVLAMGNRLAFPIQSESFAPLLKKALFVRVDLDSGECARPIPGGMSLCTDAGPVLEALAQGNVRGRWEPWLETCRELNRALLDVDCTQPVQALTRLILNQPEDSIYVCDVGNNEFWFSRAFQRAGRRGTVLCSKSFGTLGQGLGKAIGVYYAARKPIVCIVGDQGFQYHTPELQTIVKNALPIQIFVVNNRASGMIFDHEAKVLDGAAIHVTPDSGYCPPDLEAIANAYGLPCRKFGDTEIFRDAPCLCEINCDPVGLTPNLPRGNPCQDMEPLLSRDQYGLLNRK